MRDDVIFSQSGHDCPVILCPVIPYPHCISYEMRLLINHFQMLFEHRNKARQRGKQIYEMTDVDRKKLQSLQPLDNWIYTVT